MKGHDQKHTGQSPYKGPESGDRYWKFEPGDFLSGFPAIGPDGTVFVGGQRYLYAVSPNGRLKWRFEAPQGIYSSPAIRSDGTLYVHSGPYLYAISPAGVLKWKFDAPHGGISSPAIDADGTVYFFADFLYAVNPDGTLRWKVDPRQGSPSKVVRSSPAIGPDGTIYVGGGDWLIAINPQGDKKWRLPLPVGGELGSGFNDYSPTIGPDGTIYVAANDDHLYAVNPDGSLKWRFETKIDRTSPAVGADGTVYVGGEDRNLYALNPDGSLKWKAQGSGFRWSPVIDSDGVVFWAGRAFSPSGIQLRESSFSFSSSAGSMAIGSDRIIYASDGDRLLAIGKRPEPRIGFVEESLEFGAVALGTSATLALTVVNRVDEAVRVVRVSSNSAEFVASPSAFTVAAGSTQEVLVTFTPARIIQIIGVDRDSSQRKETTLYLVLDDFDDAVVEMKVAGVAANPIMAISADRLDFGSVPAGESKRMILTVSNPGLVPLLVTSLVSSSTAFEASPASFSVPASSRQEVTVTFRPSTSGGRVGILTVVSDDPREKGTYVALIANFQKLYLHQDSTLAESAYIGEERVGITYNEQAEWRYRLGGDIKGPSYVISLRAGAYGPEGGTLKAEIILASGGGETLLASATFPVPGHQLVPFQPNPFIAPQFLWSMEPKQVGETIQGVDPDASAGDVLILRVTNLKQNLGIVELPPSYVMISTN
ncbi:MAG: PQQ-binding-like beta-propeller repeat protein [Chloroflexi bacterium]|nr:PQQ-binding-like beta-propeller repeat protein [Chloroflexota bacterium]